MDEIKVIVNGAEYSEDQFKKDVARMFDSYRNKNSLYMGSTNCEDVNCDDCPFKCDESKANSFERLMMAYKWALKHPIVTNRDKMIETFGGAYFNLIINYISYRSLEDYDTWLNEEYKAPTKEEND